MKILTSQNLQQAIVEIGEENILPDTRTTCRSWLCHKGCKAIKWWLEL